MMQRIRVRKVKAGIERAFCSRKFITAQEVKSSPEHEKYFNEKLRIWTLNWMEHRNKYDYFMVRRMEAFSTVLTESQRQRLDDLAQMLSKLSADERWLVGEYIERDSLFDKIVSHSSSSLLDSPTNIEHCIVCITRCTSPR